MPVGLYSLAGPIDAVFRNDPTTRPNGQRLSKIILRPSAVRECVPLISQMCDEMRPEFIPEIPSQFLDGTLNSQLLS